MQFSRFTAVLVLCFGFVMINASNSLAQNTSDTTATSLTQLLKTNRYPLELKDGELKGEGGKWLREKAAEATVITLGETHASQEIPAVMTALIKDLQQAGEFDHLAIEVSPWTTQQLTEKLRKGRKAYDKFIENDPFAIPFYNFKTERDLLHQVVKESNKEQPLWGLDQIFVFSTNLALDRLAELAPSAAVRSTVKEVRKAGIAKTADDERLKNLSERMPTPISAYDPVTFDTLRKYFGGIEEAQQILTELIKSIEMYRLNDTNNYVSNQLRARYLRSNLREATNRARKTSEDVPQIVIKVGAYHAYRGMTPNNALDVGNLAISLARTMGGEALNVAVICGPGSQNTTFPAGTTDCWQSHLGKTFKPFESLSKEQPVLFNLTPVHPKLHEADLKLNDELEEFLWGFDAVVIIPNAKPAEPIFSPVE